MPSLSIIIPVYNVEQYLPTCLESVVEQFLSDYEVILVDDGSADDSGKICDDYSAKHPEFRVIHQDNRGLSAARNTGIRNAKGKYIFFLDSDDFLVPGSLSQVLEVALQNDVDVACFNSISGERDVLLTKKKSTRNNELRISQVMNGDEYIAIHNFLATVWWYITKREYLKSLNLTFPEGHRLEDGSFTPFVLLHANRIMHIDTSVYCYVMQPGSIMHNKERERNFNMLADYAFAGKNLTDEYKRSMNKMSQQTSDRWMGLANSYLFFGILKALRLGESKYMINHLKSMQLYPFGKLSEVDYPGKKWKVLHWLMNREMICRILTVPFKIIKLYK